MLCDTFVSTLSYRCRVAGRMKIALVSGMFRGTARQVLSDTCSVKLSLTPLVHRFPRFTSSKPT